MSNQLSGKKILIVDDELGFREILEDEFALLNSNTKSAAEVGSALALLAREDFDLIISDSSMPGRSGLEFLAEVRRTEKSHTPFILMTGFADEREDKPFGEGADAVFIKPFDMEKLLATADSIFSSPKLKKVG